MKAEKVVIKMKLFKIKKDCMSFITRRTITNFKTTEEKNFRKLIKTRSPASHFLPNVKVKTAKE